MKKTKLVLAAATTLLGFFAVGGVNAQAVTHNGMTTATVNIVPSELEDIQLTSAPTFNFGSQPMAKGGLELTATTVTDSLTVYDPGHATGWYVTVSGTKFVDEDQNNKELQNAQLTLNGAVSTAEENTSAAPTTKAITVNEQAQSIFSADADAGVGTWSDTFKSGDLNSAKLTVPEGNTAGSYTSSLTWTLTNGPETVSKN